MHIFNRVPKRTLTDDEEEKFSVFFRKTFFAGFFSNSFQSGLQRNHSLKVFFMDFFFSLYFKNLTRILLVARKSDPPRKKQQADQFFFTLFPWNLLFHTHFIGTHTRRSKRFSALKETYARVFGKSL